MSESSDPLLPPSPGPVPSDGSPSPSTPEGTGVRTDLRWHRVHPVTPFVRGWAAIGVVAVIGGQQVLENVSGALRLADEIGGLWWMVIVGVVLVLAVVFGYAALAWKMTAYAVDDDAAHLRKGILFRQQRHARLDRLQAVDVRQPLLARPFGLAELRLEVAGGADSAVAIGMLKESDAQRLRADLLARAAGVKAARRDTSPVEPAGTPAPSAPGDPATGTPAPEAPVGAPVEEAGAVDAPDDVAPEAPERPVYEVPAPRLLISLLRMPGVWLGVLVLAGVGVAVLMTRQTSILVSALPAILGIGGYLFNRFAGEFGFRAALSPDGIRLRHGLLETRAQTIPPGRVQAVSITQGPWWRGPDWWRVRVNVAGYGGGEGADAERQSVLLPVGPREEALTALWLVLPDLEAGDPDETLALLDEALSGDGRSDRWFVTSPRSARLLDPWSWRRNGYALTGRALFARTGRFVRRLDVVPHERTQSLGLAQGPWQRRRGLASVVLHTTPGPVAPAVHHLEAAEAARLLGEQSVRAREARAHTTPERWMEGPR
ncbi:PH domain-containing protein [Isoptericola sp. NEAU-Y5]|uniref:PH domain-containing protein n=1 Tax=Isoptericola luteus TaxID=2879484 RepID=A0ABS7ZDF0_9MICO|nr:PH domain-containing protein [Isoptericola sp. NEAU-Y5]MCA5893071.1 PH domain-containing protein [Isoptericola sp. NEAU-Y5]